MTEKAGGLSRAEIEQAMEAIEKPPRRFKPDPSRGGRKRPVFMAQAAIQECRWAYPDQRVGQIIANALGAEGGAANRLFTIEDSDLIDALRAYAKAGRPPPTAGAGYGAIEERPAA